MGADGGQLASRSIAPLGQIALVLARAQQASLSLDILDSVFQLPDDRPRDTGFVNRKVSKGALELSRVSFRYPGEGQIVLDDINLKIAAGERVGIIGKIGSGKTTLGRLFCGLYTPTDGLLTLDGVDMRQYHPEEVRLACAYVGQSAELFAGTLRENLLVAKPGASDEELVEAARLSGVQDIVALHPRGFDMQVGELGCLLSGGQRHAVAVARLLLMRPKLVFLDEPTGAMDMASERRIIASLRNSMTHGETLVIATHRHSMLELVDRLIVIDNGKIVADGKKDQVIELLRKRQGGAA